MYIDENLLTDKEIQIVKKLKEEMCFAVSYEHLAFYKKEINDLLDQASRRNSFLLKTSKSFNKTSCH